MKRRKGDRFGVDPGDSDNDDLSSRTNPRSSNLHPSENQANTADVPTVGGPALNPETDAVLAHSLLTLPCASAEDFPSCSRDEDLSVSLYSTTKPAGLSAVDDPPDEDEREHYSDENDDFEEDFYFCDASSECEDDIDPTPGKDESLYPGSDVSFQMAMTAILVFVMCQQLSKECVGQLLSLLQLLLPKNNLLVKSAYAFFSHFDKIVTLNHERHYYCSKCTQALLGQDAVCPRCNNRKNPDYFLTFSITEQLKNLFSQPDFYQKLSYRQSRVKKNPDAYEDIYDGEIYKEAEQSHFNIGNWISFMWNTDGFSIFKSSTYSVWPFYLSINELAPYLRMKKENMVIGGLWFGTGKFDPNLFLKPIYEELVSLKQGIYCKIHSFIDPILIQALVLCGTCDAPGKSSFFRHNQFNGLFGCMKCLTRGLKSAASGNVFVYPFERNLNLRTEESLKRHLLYLQNTQAKVRFGAKGPSFLHKILSFPIRSTSIDIMHCVFLGVQKAMLHLLFDKKHKNEDFSLWNCFNIMNEYLENVKPPHFLQRCPQPISKLAFWKASEFQSFFFFYSLPIFRIIMDPVYFNHFMLFYQGIYLLCQDSVSPHDIEVAQLLLDKFVERFQELYGLRHMTFNLHCLRHLPSVVRELGPLWTSTCFLFEDLNGALKHLVHGSQHVGLQVQSNFALLTRLACLIKSCDAGNVKDYCLQLYYPFKRLKITFSINPQYHIVGVASKTFTMSPMLQECVNRFQGNISYFKRLKSNSALFVVVSDSVGRKVSCFVTYMCVGTQSYGKLQLLFRVSQCNCLDAMCNCPAEYFAALTRLATVQPLQTLAPQVQINAVHEFTETNNIDVVPIVDLLDTCAEIQFNDKSYIVHRPNRQNNQ